MQESETNSNDQTFDADVTDLDSNLDEDERNRIIIEREKKNKARYVLLNQLQANQSNDGSLSNKNLSSNNKIYCNINKTNIGISNNLKYTNTIQVNINTNSNLNTHTNSPSKIYSASSNQNPTKANKNQSSKLNGNNILTESNLNKSKASNLLNENILNCSNIQNQKHSDKTDIIYPNLIGVDPSLIEKFNIYVTKPIYQTPDDLNEDIKKLQLENINLLKRLTSTASKVNILKQETKRLIKDNNDEIGLLKTEVEQREITFKELKDLNKNLQEEKNIILGNFNGNNTNCLNNNNAVSENNFHASKNNSNNNRKSSSIKSKFNQAILYSKVNEIFNLALEMPINSNVNKEINLNISWNNSNLITKSEENLNSNMNFLDSLKIKNDSNTSKSIQIDKDSNLMFMLKIIEKSIDFLLSRQESYSKDHKKRLQLEKLRTYLEKERKVTKAIEARLKEEKRREFLNQAIIERNRKEIILPKKRFGDKTKPIEKKKISYNINDKKEESSINDLIKD
jgi:hypothetical protein